MKGSDSGRLSGSENESGNENAKESENGRENETGRGSEGGQDLEAQTDTGMEAARLPIVQDATAPPVPEKKVEIGIVRESGNIDTRTDIAHAPTLTGAKGRGPPETDHLTPVKESAHRPRINVERDGVTTGRSTETGRTGRIGRIPPRRTQPEAGNERDPCHTSVTDAPAPRSESLERYEQEGTPPKSLIWIYCLVKGAWRDECVGERACVSALYVRSC